MEGGFNNKGRRKKVGWNYVKKVFILDKSLVVQ